jgi:hypothetical protein
MRTYPVNVSGQGWRPAHRYASDSAPAAIFSADTLARQSRGHSLESCASSLAASSIGRAISCSAGAAARCSPRSSPTANGRACGVHDPETSRSASVFLATADDIRDPAAQWSLALRQIAMIEPKMVADLKRRWIGSRSGPARGRAASNVPSPQHLVFVLTAPARSGALRDRSSDGRIIRSFNARPISNTDGTILALAGHRRHVRSAFGVVAAACASGSRISFGINWGVLGPPLSL